MERDQPSEEQAQRQTPKVEPASEDTPKQDPDSGPPPQRTDGRRRRLQAGGEVDQPGDPRCAPLETSPGGIGLHQLVLRGQAFHARADHDDAFLAEAPEFRSAEGSDRATTATTGTPCRPARRASRDGHCRYEREADAAMGKSIDNINEYEPVDQGEREWAQLADNIPERD